jgi:hypothetical protein
VLFGLGATIASVLSQAPWLVTMSHHKHWVFLVAGLLISGNFVYIYAVAPKLQARAGACDPDDPAACQTVQPGCALVLGGAVFDWGLYRVSARPNMDSL